MQLLGRIGFSGWSGGLGGSTSNTCSSRAQRWGLRDDRPVMAAGRDAPQTGQGLEDQPAVRGWPAAGIPRVKGDSGRDGAPDLPLNQWVAVVVASDLGPAAETVQLVVG